MKQAQGGMNAAVLIAVIAGLIMIYIIFLPAEEREALLENKSVDRSNNNYGNGINELLLKEFPGRVDTVEDIDDKQIPNVVLFETTNAEELDRINPFVVRSGWFDKQAKTATFSVRDLVNIDNILLTFQTTESDGILSIDLNGNNIFEGRIDGDIAPIKLNKEALEIDNTLRFTVSSVGMKFWSTNEYHIRDVRIIADVTDKSNQESESVFTLTRTELFNAEEAHLRFVPYCASAGDVGTLDITLNGRKVFSAIPVCEDAYKQPIPLSLLTEGQNTIGMKTKQGSYSVEQIRLEFDEEDIKTNVYFFELNETTLEEIEDGDEVVNLKLEFVNDEELKHADININDRFISLDQDEKDFSEDITSFVKEGNNFVEIIPRTTLDIVEITVTVEDKDD